MVRLGIAVAVRDVSIVSQNAIVLFTGISTGNPGIGVMQMSAFDVKMEEMMCKSMFPVPDGEDAHAVGDVHVDIHIHLLSLAWREIKPVGGRGPVR